MSPLDRAIRIASRYPVFPLLADKKPACKGGFKAAVRDPSAVVDLWRRYPGPLVGVPTGATSGIDALDVDPRHGGMSWLEEARDSLPITRINHTRSGGLHLLFHHADGVRNTASKIAPGVDTRGDGGYIVWWAAEGCSVEHRDALDEWPRWLLRILVPPKVQRAPTPVPATAEEADARASIMIARAWERVRCAKAGERHAALRAAAATLGGLVRFIPDGESSIKHDLVRMIMEAGGEDQRNAERTAAWAMDKGRASPLLERR